MTVNTHLHQQTAAHQHHQHHQHNVAQTTTSGQASNQTISPAQAAAHNASSSSNAQPNNNNHQQQQQQQQCNAKTSSSVAAKQHNIINNNNNNAPSTNASASLSNSSLAFQQVKQTQSSLARLSRVLQQQQQQQQQSQNNPSSQHHNHQLLAKDASSIQQQQQQQQLNQAGKSTTFVDCLIRRFKDCFSEDFCTVPMFVVGNLSPGSDGTHLILPPCISLGGQHISRFSAPKHLRLMNSIRESCQCVEELDLGGNKLTDLIEVYKILQCMPNLKFLNLSENDLSRSSPVAMANNNSSSSSLLLTHTTTGSYAIAWGQTTSCTLSSRTCLSTINQNVPARAHRLATTRRSAAAAAAAPSSLASPASRATSGPSVAAAAAVTSTAARRRSTLAASATLSQSRASLAGSSGGGATGAAGDAANAPLSRTNSKTNLRERVALKSASQRHSASGLSRSMSAKDVRCTASAAISRLAAHRSSVRAAASQQPAGAVCPRVARRQQQQQAQQAQQQQLVATQTSARRSSPTTPALRAQRPTTTTTTANKLFVDTIAETDNDVEMDAPAAAAAAPTHQQQQQQQQPSARTPIATKQQNSYRRRFESIKALALNNTGCQWRVVCSILSRMPNLEELHLSLNNYERIDLEPSDFKHTTLKRLYLCDNPKLTNWEELDKILLAFPSLEALSIANCSISQIPDNLDRAREWRKLCGLNINGWPIKEWPVVERLNQLPSLVDLKCRDLDVLNSIDEPREHLIARLPKLQRLNGSEIEEREHAEKSFLRFFLANAHLERPSRFHELVQIHGEIVMSPVVDVDVDLSPPSQAHVRVIYINRNHYRKENNDDDIMMSEDFITKLMDNVDEPAAVAAAAAAAAAQDVQMQHNDDTSAGNKLVRLFKDEGQEVIAIEVDLRQSVRKFKSSLAQLFGLRTHNLILYYIDHEMVGLMGPEQIKHNQKKLWNYNVQDGDQFIVEEQ